MLKQKKAFIPDILYIAVVMCVIGIGMFVSTKALHDINANYQTTNASTESKAIINDASSRMAPVFDNIFVLIAVLLVVSVIITVSLLRSSPAILMLVLILIGFALIPIAIMGNFFNDVQNDPSLSTTVSEFSITTYLMEHLVLIMVGFIFITLVVLYAR